MIGLEDELFGTEREQPGVTGEGALLAALAANRTGRLGDIVGTIQAEQDEVIRADHHGILVVQGGPRNGQDGRGPASRRPISSTPTGFRSRVRACSCWDPIDSS